MKIHNIKELSRKLKEEKTAGKKVVHCHGVFDLLHIGHIRYFKQARAMGDVLVVTITPDRYVDKGPHRPAFPESLRAEAVASLSFVDYVAVNDWPTAEETLRLLRPDVYVKGAEFKDISTDMTGKIGKEAAVIEEIGAEIAFAEDIVFSSTNLINRYLSSLPDEINQYLNLFRQRYTIDDILAVIDKMAGLRVLVVGDTILDDYQYCTPLGKSSKDPVLTVLHQSGDLFAGGILAVANHVANFSDHVDLVTVLGDGENHEAFIRSQLHSNVTPNFFCQKGAPTITKRRFVDGYSFNKLFEVYLMNDAGLSDEADDDMCRFVEAHLPQYDLVLVADYGHGAVSSQMVRILCEGARFLAVNAQSNSGNRGFHTVTRYSRADFVCMAEHEIRLEMRQRNGSIRPMMETLSRDMQAKQVVVTRGRNGCLVADGNADFVAVPAFARSVVDRVGAGDAFLSITAMASVLDIPGEPLGFIGNIAGSLAVETIGNKKAVDKLSLKKNIVSLLK